MILEIRVFNHFILPNELFTKAFQGNETCLFVRITNQFLMNFRVFSVEFFGDYFNL